MSETDREMPFALARVVFVVIFLVASAVLHYAAKIDFGYAVVISMFGSVALVVLVVIVWSLVVAAARRTVARR